MREQPSSAEIRRDPQPSAFSRSIADTSSGSFISSLRRPSVRGSVSVVMSVIQTSLSAHQRGQILMSPEGQFVVSPDTISRLHLSSTNLRSGNCRSDGGGYLREFQPPMV